MKITLLSVALLSALQCMADEDELEHIVVIAPMQSPLLLQTDPKLPRQPLPAQDGADLLSSITGFSLIKKGAASSDPVFRGMAGSRLNIITDGGLTLGGCGSRMDPPTAYITPQTYDTLTVIKGPQTVLYGSGNSAATVIFERDQQRLQKPQLQGFANAVVASAERRSINVDIKAGTPDYYFRVAGSHSRAGDYQDGNNTTIHSNYKRWNGDMELAYTPSDDNIISLTYGRSDGEVAYADRMMDGSLFDRTHGAIRAQWALSIGVINHLDAQWYYNDVDHIMDNHSLRQFKPNMMMKLPTSANPDRRSQGGKIVFDAQLNTSNTLKFGLDHLQDRHRNRSSMNQLNNPVQLMPRKTDGEFKKLGLFGEHELSLGEHQQIISGLRIDRWQAKDLRQQITMMMKKAPNPTANTTRKDTLWSGFTRYAQQSENRSYFIGFGHTERFPDYWELLGGNRMAINSSSAFNTNVEKTNQLDFGIQHASTQWQSNVSLFYNRISDFILTDNAYGQVAMQRKVTRNIDAETLGFEADINYHLTKYWQAAASFSYVRGSNLTDHIALAQQPPLQMRVTLDYEQKTWRVGMLWHVAAAQHRVAPAQGNIAGQDITPTSGYGTLSLNAQYNLSKGVDWSMGVDNLFDKIYAQHLSKSGSAVSGYQQIDKVNEAGLTLWSNINWRF
ncbi:hypothetical protein PSECIP111951_02214 [Pseudoalteromonas holothuriae]|uniref:TonB-dependent copper receptor n=1 Tax=Pseudoalteromonas holothuriae TaxID=2963714 RepID=A0ABM9GJ45_9GAMM|nr:TonB-dependent copper receptor [Pseudoalteromonas sp. CIP111951]CAH9060154.1 hypothetical protein PSECIP111951_02214 [Pseudoalteromonas sp. CIP111951]